MKASPAAYDLIKRFEGLRLTAYRCPAGLNTIGWGHTRGVQPGQAITEAQAEELLREDVASCEAALGRLLKVPVTQPQFDALISWVFNLGEKAVSKSTLIRLLNDGQPEKAALEFSKWKFSSGKVLAGLIVRRSAEQYLFNQPYESA